MPASNTMSVNRIEELKQVSLDLIRPKDSEFREKEVVESDDFQDLFLSIKIHGVLQPITLREHNVSPKKYQIIDGGRRYRACLMLGFKTIPAIIRRSVEDGRKNDLVWSYVQNVQNKQLTDIEKAKAIRAIYENYGYNLDTALQHLNNLRNNKYADQKLKVPPEFIDLANSIGRANSTQWFFLKLLKDVPQSVLKYAEQAGLDSAKKQMLTYPSIRNDPKLQKAVVNMIKDIPKESARQLVHNIETGAYKFTGTGFKVVSGSTEKIQAEPMDFSKDAFLAFNETTKLVTRLLELLTGIETSDYSLDDIKNSRGYRLEKIKQLTERELTLLWNILKPLNAAVTEEMSLVEQELETRSRNRKLTER